MVTEGVDEIPVVQYVAAIIRLFVIIVPYQK